MMVAVDALQRVTLAHAQGLRRQLGVLCRVANVHHACTQDANDENLVPVGQAQVPDETDRKKTERPVRHAADSGIDIETLRRHGRVQASALWRINSKLPPE